MLGAGANLQTMEIGNSAEQMCNFAACFLLFMSAEQVCNFAEH